MKIAKVLFNGLVLMLLSGMVFSGSVMGEEQGQQDLSKYTCKDVMRMSGGDRDLSIGIMHAFLLGKKGTTTFDIAKLSDITDTFIETCLDNPGDKALETMEKLSK